MASATVKSNFYKWHRVLGLTALIPVIFWTLSGLSHPFMSNWFRPSIAEEVFKPLPQSQMKPVLSIQQVLDKNNISVIRNFGLINFNHNTYYQVLDKDSVYNYYSANDGVLLKDGDKLYATYLARYFTQDSTSNIKKIALQTTFDGQYQPINHLCLFGRLALTVPMAWTFISKPVRAAWVHLTIIPARLSFGCLNNSIPGSFWLISAAIFSEM
ncbi:hypothetical protein ACRQ5D_01325 [Mucilaginibacter sp. P25]|uniref:hypothetical protein n=1 Tax=Mucilaginibacter sp. P25 TaxID=3423945 RepID=UPI003D7AE599